jgi:hypothetical protein
MHRLPTSLGRAIVSCGRPPTVPTTLSCPDEDALDGMALYAGGGSPAGVYGLQGRNVFVLFLAGPQAGHTGGPP